MAHINAAAGGGKVGRVLQKTLRLSDTQRSFPEKKHSKSWLKLRQNKLKLKMSQNLKLYPENITQACGIWELFPKPFYSATRITVKLF